VKTHANKPKATTAPDYAWFVTTTLCGRGGGPAAVQNKFIRQSEAHPSFWAILDDEEKTPPAWGALFAKARLAQAIGEEDAARLTADNDSDRIDPLKYITPRKPARLAGLTQGSPESDDLWEGVPSSMTLPGTPAFVGIDISLLNSPSSMAGKDINNVRRAIQALQENFATI
jgi:hypothetical protein